MVTKQDIAELNKYLEVLRGRPERFKAKGLDSRIPGVLAEIERHEKLLAKWCATYRWQKEVYK